jgi:hypothetical protein
MEPCCDLYDVKIGYLNTVEINIMIEVVNSHNAAFGGIVKSDLMYFLPTV